MAPRNQLAANIIDRIVSGSTPSEVAQSIKDALFSKAAERVDDYRAAASDQLFNGDDSDDPVTRGAKPAERMQSVKAMPQSDRQLETATKRYQNQDLLKQGQDNDTEGWKEPANWKGQGRGAEGWMNPKGDPMRPWGGDRRPNRAGGPEMPFDDGTVPNGAGV